MDKKSELDDDISSLQNKIKEWEESHQDVSSSAAPTLALISETKQFLEKMESQKMAESKDINSKLSDYAQNIIQDTKGPLTSYQLFKFLTNDDLKKKTLTSIRRYSNNVIAVKEQVSKVRDKLETHATYMKKQKELDDRFTKKLKKLDKSIEDELEKETRPHKTQSTLNRFLNAKKAPPKQGSPRVRGGSTSGGTSSQAIFVEQAAKRGKRRRGELNNLDDGIREVTSGIGKRLKLNSSESSQNSETDSDESDSQESELSEKRFNFRERR